MSTMTFWLVIGFLGQALFTSRFVIQWLVSEHNATRSYRWHSGG